MDNPFLNTIRLPVRTSPLLIFGIIMLHFISLFLPWFSSLAIWIIFVIMVLTIVSLAVYLYRVFFDQELNRISELILDAEDNWQVKTINNESYAATLGSSLFVHPLISIISLAYKKDGDKRKKYFILSI